MKLPEGRKQRMQIFILIAIFGMGGLYGIFQFVVMPLWTTHTACKAEIVELKKEIETADKETKKISSKRQESVDLRAQLREIDEKYVLKSEFSKLRNFDIKAKEQIRKAAEAANIKLETTGIVGETKFGKGSALRSYIMRVTARVGVDSPWDGYSSLTNFVMAFETGNPYVTISSVQIEASETPGPQLVAFHVGWPVWEDPDIVATFKERPEDSPGDRKPASGTGEDSGT